MKTKKQICLNCGSKKLTGGYIGQGEFRWFCTKCKGLNKFEELDEEQIEDLEGDWMTKLNRWGLDMECPNCGNDTETHRNSSDELRCDNCGYDEGNYNG